MGLLGIALTAAAGELGMRRLGIEELHLETAAVDFGVN
jgi:hypothetical protein